MGKFFLGIDIGTFESKGVLVDGETFRITASHAVAHGMENPKPNYFEHDAEKVWWHDYCEICQVLTKQVKNSEIVCVGTSTLGTDCLPVDENCRPLRKAILYGVDARADGEIAWLNEYYGGEEKATAVYGHKLRSDDIMPKILWIKNNEPEVYAKTYKFLTGASYIGAKLTGRYRIDQFLAKSSFSPVYRPDGSIDESLCALYCRPDQLAQCALSTEVIGRVTAEAAKETGLAEGTPVISGTGDSTAEAISGGLTGPGRLLMQFGSTMFFYYCIDRQVSGDSALPGSFGFTIPGTYCLGGGTNAAGTLTRWVRDVYYFPEVSKEQQGGENAYSVMARDAASVPAGCGGLIMLPYILGERSPIYDIHARGVLFGLTGEHDRRYINRAALEAVAYSVRQHIELFRSRGLSPESITIAGGGTKNPVWMQIVADVTGLPVVVSQPWQTASYGDAVMAAIGSGSLEGFRDLDSVMPANREVLPNKDNRAVYDRLYPIYTELYQRNKDLMHTLGAEEENHAIH